MPKRPKSKAIAAIHEAMSDLNKAGAITDARMREFDKMCEAADPAPRAIVAPSFYVFKDANGEWRWRLVAANGKQIATSGEGYKSKAKCVAAIELVKKSADAPVAA